MSLSFEERCFVSHAQVLMSFIASIEQLKPGSTLLKSSTTGDVPPERVELDAERQFQRKADKCSRRYGRGGGQ